MPSVDAVLITALPAVIAHADEDLCAKKTAAQVVRQVLVDLTV